MTSPNELRRSLGFTDLMLITIGTVIGSGIYLVPSIVLQQTGGNTGLAFLVWAVAGVLSLLGALTYAELGGMKPEAGGLYAYLRDAFGPLPAFLFGWASFLVIASGSIAALSVAFANYLAPLLPFDDPKPIISVVVIAVVAAILLTRGGSDNKGSAASSSSSSAASKSSSSSASRSASDTDTDSATDFAPAGFITVNHSFEHGDVELFVPNDWTQNDPVELANGEPQLRAAPDVDAFLDGTFAHSGVQLDAFGVTENGVANPDDLDGLVDNFASQPPENGGWPGGPLAAVCTPGARGNYPDDLGTTSDGGFTGRFQRFDSCRGAGAVVVVFATPADKSFIVQMVVGITSPDDEAALPTIVGSVIVVNFP